MSTLESRNPSLWKWVLPALLVVAGVALALLLGPDAEPLVSVTGQGAP